jgi:hypothetical protein
MIRQLIVMRMEMMFKPELATVPEGNRRKIVLALEALTAFESWGAHARALRPVGRAGERVWMRTIDRLLPATPA